MLVILAGLLIWLSRLEWCVIFVAITSVWTAEALNSAIEFLADEVSLEKRELIGKAKDAGAAGVLLASAGAAVIGLIVFLPHWIAPALIR